MIFRKAAIIVLLLMLLHGAYSKSLEATGYGGTPKDARDDVERQLVKSVFGALSFNEESRHQFEDAGNLKDEFRSDSVSLYSGMLKYVEFGRPVRNEDGSYEVIAFIDESRSQPIREELVRLRDEFKSLGYDSNSKSAELTFKALDIAKRFDSLNEILVSLSGDRIYGIPYSYDEISKRYRDLELESSFDDLFRSSRYEFQAKIAKSEEELYEKIRNQQKLEKEALDKVGALISEELRKIRTLSAASDSVPNREDKEDELEEDILRLKSLLEKRKTAMERFDSLLNQEKSLVFQQKTAVLNEVHDRAWEPFELTSAGQPAKSARKRREQEREYYEKLYDGKADEIASMIESEREKAIGGMDSEMKALCSLMEKKAYRIGRNGIRLPKAHWIEEESAWVVEAGLYSSVFWKIEFRLPYEDALKERSASSDYAWDDLEAKAKEKAFYAKRREYEKLFEGNAIGIELEFGIGFSTAPAGRQGKSGPDKTVIRMDIGRSRAIIGDVSEKISSAMASNMEFELGRLFSEGFGKKRNQPEAGKRDLPDNMLFGADLSFIFKQKYPKDRMSETALHDLELAFHIGYELRVSNGHRIEPMLEMKLNSFPELGYKTVSLGISACNWNLLLPKDVMGFGFSMGEKLLLGYDFQLSALRAELGFLFEFDFGPMKARTGIALDITAGGRYPDNKGAFFKMTLGVAI